MSTALSTREDRLLVYIIVPIAIFFLGGTLFYGTYYTLAAVQSELVAGIPLGQITFGIYIMIAVMEWALAISISRKLRRAGGSVMDLIAPQGVPWTFRRLPAVLVFLGFNGLMAVFMTFLRAFAAVPVYEGLRFWQCLLFVIMIPITAGYCEELIWRGYIITRLEARGRTRWAVIFLAALSFALIHSPFHWPFTFLIGLLAGYYYTRERNLMPLMISHAVSDLWSFGWFLFVL